MNMRFDSKTPPKELDLWQTPFESRDFVRRVLGCHFLDPCPSERPECHWAPVNGDWIDPFVQGLLPAALPADIPAYMNPPYSDLLNWTKRAENHARHAPVLGLLPVRTDTEWWSVYGQDRSVLRVYFPRRRIRFLRPDGTPGSSPRFASVWILWGRRNRDAATIRSFELEVRSEGAKALRVV
jgi:hypothetical protein